LVKKYPKTSKIKPNKLDFYTPEVSAMSTLGKY